MTCRYCGSQYSKPCPITRIETCQNDPCIELLMGVIFGPRPPWCEACGETGTALTMTGMWFCEDCRTEEHERFS